MDLKALNYYSQFSIKSVLSSSKLIINGAIVDVLPLPLMNESKRIF